MRFLSILLALACLAAAAPAQNPERVKLKTGDWLVGQPRSYDPETKVLVFQDEGGSERTVHLDELDPRSAYRTANSVSKRATPSQLVGVGNFARDLGFFAHAARHYDDALKQDPGLRDRVEAERVVLRRVAAEACMDHAREAMEEGDEKEAEKWLTTLVQKLPDEPLAAEASALLDAHYAKVHQAQDDAYEARFEELLTTELATAKKHYDAMLERIQKGLTSSSSSRARGDFERAYKEGEKTLRELDRVQKRLEKADSAAEVQEAFDGYRGLTVEHMVEAQLHLASQYTTSTSYNRALKEVNKALALDPDNRRALQARARIENAASRGWRW